MPRDPAHPLCGTNQRSRELRQHEVWQRIGRYETELGGTASSSVLDHLNRVAGAPARQMAGQRGVIIGIGGRVIGAEIFASSSGLASRWRGIVDAAALDARLAEPVHTSSHSARSFARTLATVPLEDGGDAGLARQRSSEQGNTRVSALGFARQSSFEFELDRIIHLSAFNTKHPLLENA
jgi:hypothetical protein